MTRFVTSAPTRPRYEPNRYRPSPERRRFIHGKLLPMDPPRRKPIRALLRKIFG